MHWVSLHRVVEDIHTRFSWEGVAASCGFVVCLGCWDVAISPLLVLASSWWADCPWLMQALLSSCTALVCQFFPVLHWRCGSCLRCHPLWRRAFYAQSILPENALTPVFGYAPVFMVGSILLLLFILSFIVGLQQCSLVTLFLVRWQEH